MLFARVPKFSALDAGLYCCPVQVRWSPGTSWFWRDGQGAWEGLKASLGRGRLEGVSHLAGTQVGASRSHPGQVGVGTWDGGEGEAGKFVKTDAGESPGGEF